VSRVLVYCGFQHRQDISLPAAGVQGLPVQVMEAGPLRLLWSAVAWPFDSANIQQHAVEYHGAVNHIFRQSAVVPFRLLSVFDDQAALAAFITENQPGFLHDLERLKNFVQMEFVVYPAPGTIQTNTSSGTAYLRQKATALRSAEGFVHAMRETVAHLCNEIRTRENKNGIRVFALVERGRENEFRHAVSSVPMPEHLSRRMSGPWPAAEFLSEQVRSPQITPATGAQ
jgi:hypothetical protein